MASATKPPRSVKFRCIGQSSTARTFSGSGSIPLSLTLTACPKNLGFNWNNLYFAGFSLSHALRRRFITISGRPRCRSNVSAITMTSSKYARQTFQVSPVKTRSISLWNNAGALIRPKLRILNLKVPLLVTNAVLSADSGSVDRGLPVPRPQI